MEKVVYWLGAGFSAPLEIPVMSNFLTKSKDQFAQEPEVFAHFESVFKRVDRLAKTKNFYATNLFNIEEILSLLEMNALLETDQEAFRKLFVTYIEDVINRYTPPLRVSTNGQGNWYAHFASSPLETRYVAFVAALLGVKLRISQDGKQISSDVSESEDFSYGVVTVNYDLVLERAAAGLKDVFGSPRSFATSRAALGDYTVPLAKLHGSVGNGDIIAPTWNKALRKNMEESWILAHKILSEANHIRIIGYSLPKSDSYVRYLLMSAALESENLKSIDVICLDPDGSVKENYDEFIEFPSYNFVHAPVEDYLAENWDHKLVEKPPQYTYRSVRFSRLEEAHGKVERRGELGLPKLEVPRLR